MELEKFASELARERVATMDVNGVPIVIAPAGYEVHDLERLLDAPVHLSRNICLRTANDLICYVRLFQQPTTRMYLSLGNRKIAAIIDDHESDGAAGSCKHSARLEIEFSDEFKIWSALANNRAKSQAEFLAVLRDNRNDISSISGADLLGIIQDFRATKNASYRALQNLDNGDVAIEYAHETRGVGHVRVPEQISLYIPVFDGEDPQFVDLRLRFDIDDGSLRFFIEIVAMNRLVKEATRAVFSRVERDLSTVPSFMVSDAYAV